MSSTSDFKWCIENDWQVYIKLINTLHCKIAIRKGGITSNGKDYYYCKRRDLSIRCKEKLGNVVYKSQQKAFEALPSVYKYLKDNYNFKDKK